MVQIVIEHNSRTPEAMVLKLLNRVTFEYNNLSINQAGELWQNKYSTEVYTFIGSCNVENEAIGVGVNYILRDTQGANWLVSKKGFEVNFVKGE